MAVTDASGLPIAIGATSASPAEVTLVESTIEPLGRIGDPLHPKRLIADRAYDSDPLRERLEDRFTKLICPHRRGRKRKATQDGRALRRYKKRWRVERLFAWLHNYRRIVVRWEYHLENYIAFLQLACAMILLKTFMR